MPKSPRLIKHLDTGFTLCVVEHDVERNSVAEAVARKLVEFVMSKDRYTMYDIEAVVMDEYEELKAMHRLEDVDVKFKWGVVYKMQKPPYTEKRVLAIMQGMRVLVSIKEDV